MRVHVLACENARVCVGLTFWGLYYAGLYVVFTVSGEFQTIFKTLKSFSPEGRTSRIYEILGKPGFLVFLLVGLFFG